MEWTEETISRLKELWAEGLSTAEIGRRLSITKNAVVGKAHRLSLPPRPSPIRRGEKKLPVAPKVAAAPAPGKTEVTAEKTQQPEGKPTTAPAKAEKVAAVTTPQPTASEKPAVKAEKAAPAARAPARSKPAISRISDPEPKKRRGPTCCWPIGDPGTPGFHFCGATPLPGKPYCAEHAQIAYVKLRDRRDNVA